MALLDIIFPKKCLGCGKSGSYLCNRCLNKEPKTRPVCFYCRRYSEGGKTHYRCIKEFGVDGFYSGWIYRGVIRKAMIKLKYRFAYDIANEISERFIENLSRQEIKLFRNAVLVSVPMHRVRMNWRGFNQAEILAKKISEKFGLRIVDNLLIKSKPGKIQTKLNRTERKTNIVGAFELNSGLRIPDNSKKYIVFDDICTTGSTLKEACRVLKKAGIKIVWVATIART